MAGPSCRYHSLNLQPVPGCWVEAGSQATVECRASGQGSRGFSAAVAGFLRSGQGQGKGWGPFLVRMSTCPAPSLQGPQKSSHPALPIQPAAPHLPFCPSGRSVGTAPGSWPHCGPLTPCPVCRLHADDQGRAAAHGGFEGPAGGTGWEMCSGIKLFLIATCHFEALFLQEIFSVS